MDTVLGIILVPVHTSWSYPRRCPVTARMGGAALAAGTAPLPHDPGDRQTDRQTATLPLLLPSTCAPGADPARDKQEISSRAGWGHCRETASAGSKYPFLSLP